MSPAMHIRKATTGDIPALSNLARETYVAAFGPSMSATDLASHLENNLSPQNIARMLETDIILVAEADGHLIGYVQFGRVDPSFEAVAETDQELRRLYVLSEYQNQGIGSKLMNAALEHPILKNTERIYLDVWEHNHGAQKLYKRYGFTVIGQRKFEVESGAETSFDLIMALEQRRTMNNIELEHLKAAISVAQHARQHGNHPFGAVLVDENNKIVLEAENTVVTGRDVTGHAETNLVRLATGKFSPEQLVRYTLYTSTEPCAMCAGAIYWSQIGRVVYALSEVGLYEIIGPSPEHLLLPCREVFAHSERHVEVLGPAPELDAEARAVHQGFWTTTR